MKGKKEGQQLSEGHLSDAQGAQRVPLSGTGCPERSLPADEILHCPLSPVVLLRSGQLPSWGIMVAPHTLPPPMTSSGPHSLPDPR